MVLLADHHASDLFCSSGTTDWNKSQSRSMAVAFLGGPRYHRPVTLLKCHMLLHIIVFPSTCRGTCCGDLLLRRLSLMGSTTTGSSIGSVSRSIKYPSYQFASTSSSPYCRLSVAWSKTVVWWSAWSKTVVWWSAWSKIVVWWEVALRPIILYISIEQSLGKLRPCISTQNTFQKNKKYRRITRQCQNNFRIAGTGFPFTHLPIPLHFRSALTHQPPPN